MGICQSGLTDEERHALEMSKKLEQMIKDDFDEERDKIKLLLLGAGESGKSTIFKQMKILYGAGLAFYYPFMGKKGPKKRVEKNRIHRKKSVWSSFFDRFSRPFYLPFFAPLLPHILPFIFTFSVHIFYSLGFSEEERMSFRRYIWSNIVESMKAICDACFGFGYANEIEDQEAFDGIMKISYSEDLTPEIGQWILRLWQDETIQKTWERRSEFQVIESTKDFVANITTIASESYVPSTDDVLHARVRTTGIVEERYLIDKNIFVMFDVGGQRNERKKWIHCFDEVNAVIFVASLSEFDQVLFEDETTNRMVEGINLFDEICNSRWFVNTSMILFLNKMDLFREKIDRVEIVHIPEFADYSGKPNDYEDGVSYFLEKFLQVNKKPEREVYHHVTCATDTSNIQFVFNTCKEIILQQNLNDSGFVD